MDKIAPYRQPVVTATGIFLGFMLNFTTSWMPTAFSKTPVRDTVLAVGCVVSIAFLIIVLFRVLRVDYSDDRAHHYYKRTLVMFLIAISIPFFSLLLIIISKFVTNVL